MNSTITTTTDMPSNNSAEIAYDSTLLIPEETAWLPYAGLVLTVVLWLGYDFYRFHGRNKEKYVHLEEHLSIERAAPPRQRISMVSGVGIRFKRGKLVLGDEAWDTSPSTNDIPGCCSPSRRAPEAYSKDMTSHEDGADTNGCCFRHDERAYIRDVASFEDDEDIPVMSRDSTSASYIRLAPLHLTVEEERLTRVDYTDSLPESSSQDSCGSAFNPQTRGYEKEALTALIQRTPIAAHETSCSDNNQFDAGSQDEEIDDYVDDRDANVEGRFRRSSHDAGTQTSSNYFLKKISSEEQSGFDSYLDQGYICSETMPTLKTGYPEPHSLPEASDLSPSHHRNASIPLLDQPERSGPLARRTSQDDESSDLLTNLTVVRCVSGTSDRRFPSMRRGLVPELYLPTTESSTTQHDYTLEGFQLSDLPGAGNQTIPSSESGICTDSQGHSQPSFKPVTSSLGVIGNTLSPFSDSSQAVTHQTRRDQKTGKASSKTLLPPIETFKSSTLPSRTKHGISTASQAISARDSTTETWGFKNLQEPLLEPPQTAAIPPQFYHEDEEGFFSSISSLSSKSGRTFNRDGDECPRRGILFFSRLSGSGGRQEQGGSGQRKNSVGGFQAGGFES